MLPGGPRKPLLVSWVPLMPGSPRLETTNPAAKMPERKIQLPDAFVRRWRGGLHCTPWTKLNALPPGSSPHQLSVFPLCSSSLGIACKDRLHHPNYSSSSLLACRPGAAKQKLTHSSSRPACHQGGVYVTLSKVGGHWARTSSGHKIL